MATDRVQPILSSVHTKVQSLLKPERFYILLLNPTKAELRFVLVSEGGSLLPAEHEPWAARRADATRAALPDQLLTQKQSLFYEQDFEAQISQDGLSYWPGAPLPASWLGVPLLSGEQALGALVVESWGQPQAFGENGRRLLEAIAQQTALALQNAWLYERLERKVEYLSVLNKVGQQITSGVGRSEQEILKNIYEQARQLPLDTNNMYIALFDAEQDVITYPFVCTEGQQIDTNTVERWQPRKGLQGRTGWIIQERKPRLTRTIHEADDWYETIGTEEQSRRRFTSWIGAPMIYGDRVLGVIAAYHRTEEYKYDEDDLEALQILAGQAAVAIQNLRFYEAWMQEQDKVNAANRLTVMSDVASEFAHRMNNLAGTIPVRVNLAKEMLDPNAPRDAEILKHMDKVYQDGKQLLQAAQTIKKTTEQKPPEVVKINELVEIALGRAAATQISVEGRITIIKEFAGDLPELTLEREKLLDTLFSIIKNGLEAMPDAGTLTVCTRSSNAAMPSIEILVTDTGTGIQPRDLTKIFDLFYTTKGAHGLGYGLWRDKAFIKELGGDIDVHSEVSKGTTFKIKIPSRINQTLEAQADRSEA